MKALWMALFFSTSCGAQTLNCSPPWPAGPYGLHPGFGGDTVGTSVTALEGTATAQVCKRFLMEPGMRQFGYFYALEQDGNALKSGVMSKVSPSGSPDESTFDLRWKFEPSSGIPSTLNPRVEIVPSMEYMPSGVRWYAVSVYLPADWTSVSATSLFQLHTKQRTLPGTQTRPAITVPPPMAFIADGTKLKLHLRSSTRDVTGEDVPTSTNVEEQNITLGTLETQRWYCVIVRADWQSAVGTGNFAVWLNGKLRYEARNVHNHYVNAESYPKAGFYMPGTRSDTSQHIYVTAIHIGDTKADYRLMEGKTKCEPSPVDQDWQTTE